MSTRGEFQYTIIRAVTDFVFWIYGKICSVIYKIRSNQWGMMLQILQESPNKDGKNSLEGFYGKYETKYYEAIKIVGKAIRG